MTLAPVLLLLALAPPPPPDRSIAAALGELGCPVWACREAAADVLLAACRRRPELLEEIAGRLDDPDPEVRWRVWRIARTLRPCEVCRGRAAIVDWYDHEYPCRYCTARGSAWVPRRWLPDPPCASCHGRGGTYWGDARSLNWEVCQTCKGIGMASPRPDIKGLRN